MHAFTLAYGTAGVNFRINVDRLSILDNLSAPIVSTECDIPGRKKLIPEEMGRMTSAQITTLVVLLVVCCFSLIWSFLQARQEKIQVPATKVNDKEEILEMLTRVEDQFSLSVYKNTYNISDNQIAEKRKNLREKI